MRSSSTIFVLVAAVTVWFTGACSVRVASPVSVSAPAESTSRVINDHGPDYGNWIYTCVPSNKSCPVYTVSGTTLSYYSSVSGISEPEGSFGADVLWYVADYASSTVPKFISGKNGPRAYGAMLDPDEHPVDVVSTGYGEYVSNALTTKGKSGDVVYYKFGSNTHVARSRTYAVPGGLTVGGSVTVDSSDLVWAVRDPNRGMSYIVDFPGGTTGTAIVSTGDPLGGIAFDGSNNLYYVDESQGVYKCTGLTNCALFATGPKEPASMCFDEGWQHLWVTDIKAAEIYAFDPITGETLSTTPMEGGASNIAVGIAAAPAPY